ncbi:MAG TPA: hypothetical protein VN380_23385 [Thermoanaerobaculia bacterium]|nr:hypothetical protein [Thermoanaerobaculia bacterium]
MKALTERLGPGGAMRFMMQYAGHGDYTKERRELFADLTIDDILNALNERDRKIVADDGE